MPRPNPLPSSRHANVRLFWRIFRLLALFSIAIAAIAVVLVARGDKGVHIHMLVATALAVGMTVLLGTGLMVLMFLSSRSGHDEQAQAPTENDE